MKKSGKYLGKRRCTYKKRKQCTYKVKRGGSSTEHALRSTQSAYNTTVNMLKNTPNTHLSQAAHSLRVAKLHFNNALDHGKYSLKRFHRAAKHSLRHLKYKTIGT